MESKTYREKKMERSETTARLVTVEYTPTQVLAECVMGDKPARDKAEAQALADGHASENLFWWSECPPWVVRGIDHERVV